jgi:hypothetical protein
MEVKAQIHLNIETASTCNARCHFCPYSTEGRLRPAKKMSEDLFHKIIDEVATIPLITGINLQGLNEPLLDKRLEDFIRYIGDTAPNVAVGLYTNGVLLTPERYRSLKAAGLSRLIVSLNAVNQEQHEKIMGIPGAFEKVCAHIEYAMEHPPHTLQVHAVYTSDTFSREDCLKFYERWGDWSEGLGIGVVCRDGNWGGSMYVPPRATGIVVGNQWCFRATNTIYITCEGLITTCCMDPFGKQVFGDVNTQTIREIYNGDKYTKFREDHANDRADNYDICRGCARV